MAARLDVFLTDRPTHRVLLAEENEYLIGREGGCDVVIDDPRISRRHARLLSGDGGWRVVDLASKNGTTVDGRPCTGEEALGALAWISFGGLLARFERLATAARGNALPPRERWQTSLELNRRLDPSLGLTALLHQLLASISALTGAERAFVMLTRPDGDLELAATLSLTPAEVAAPGFRVCLSALERALATGTAVTAADVRDDPRLGDRPSVLAAGIRTLVCLPLQVVERKVGVIYADSGQSGHAFADLDLEILGAVAGHAALAVSVARLAGEVDRLRQALPIKDLKPTGPLVLAHTSGDLVTAWDRSLASYRPRAPEALSPSSPAPGEPLLLSRLLAAAREGKR